MNNFKVNQPRTSGLVVINNVGHARVTVRPRAAKLIAPKLMSAPEFDTSRFNHLPCECAAI
jgi:hypothetical protein